MRQVSAWVGAGVLAAGVSAAMFAGAGAASADEGGSDSGGTATSSTSDAASKPTASTEHRKRPTLGERDSGTAKEPRRLGHLRRGEASVRDRVRDDGDDQGAEEAAAAGQDTTRTTRADRKPRRAVDLEARPSTETGVPSSTESGPLPPSPRKRLRPADWPTSAGRSLRA